MKNADNFLFYSYFRTTVNECREWKQVKKVAFQKAYLDATNQGAFNTYFTGKNKNKKCVAENTKGNVEEKLSNLLDNLFLRKKFDCTQEGFDNWHENAVEGVRKIYKEAGIDFFCVGNAQKLINMAIKYIDIISSLVSSNCNFDVEAITKWRSFFHFPIDSYMLEAIWYMNNKNVIEKFPGLENRTNITEGKKGLRAYPREFIEPWSTWDDYDIYLDFQKAVKDNLMNDYTPLEWEDKVWIKAAKFIKGENHKKAEGIEFGKELNELIQAKMLANV